MRFKIYLLCVAVSILSSALSSFMFSAHAQSHQDWSYDFSVGEDYAHWMDKSNGLIFVLGKGDTLITFDLYDHQILSKAYLKGLHKSCKLSPLEGYPFVRIKNLEVSNKLSVNNLLKSTTDEKRQVLVNYMTGQMVFDSREAFSDLTSQTKIKFQYDAQAVFSKGKVGKQRVFSCESFLENEDGWTKNIPIKIKPLSLKDNIWQEAFFNQTSMVIGYANHLYGYDRRTGELKWQRLSKSYLGSSLPWISQADKWDRTYDPLFYVREPNDSTSLGGWQLNAYRLDTGEPGWGEPLELGRAGFNYKIRNNAIILARGNKLDLISLTDGSAVWPEPLKSDLSIKSIKMMQNAIVVYRVVQLDSTVAVQTVRKTEEEEKGLSNREIGVEMVTNLAKKTFQGDKTSHTAAKSDTTTVAPTPVFDTTYMQSSYKQFHFNAVRGSSFLWDSAVSVSGSELKFLHRYKDQEVYMTNHEVGVIDSKGRKVFKANIDIASISLLHHDVIHRELLFFDGKNLSKVNYKNLSYTEKIASFEPHGDAQVADRLWSIDEGYVLASDRNVALFDTTGAKVYHKYFKKSGLSDKHKTAILRAGLLATSYALTKDTDLTLSMADELGVLNSSGLSSGSSLLTGFSSQIPTGSMGEKFLERTVKIKSKAGNSTMMTNFWFLDDELSQDKYGLRIVDVRTGEEKDPILVREEKDTEYYLMDELGGVLHWEGPELVFQSIE